jgi:REP element-mobilizing transposase RayT
MARSKRIKETAAGVAYYHVISRTNNKVFLFDSVKTKDALVDALVRSAVFSGVEIEAYAIMSNHIHAVIKVMRPECVASPMGPVPNWVEAIPEAELLRRVEVLKGEKARQALEMEWRELRKAGLEARLELEQNRLRVRMNDVSEFVKTFKETFDRVYKKDYEYCGSIWSGRFTSTLIEDGEYLARCRKYVYYNPIRAGIVTRAAMYRWSYDRSLSEVGENAALVGETSDFAASQMGPVPNGWWMRKVAQMGAGKVFGSMAFVMRKASGLGHLFPAKRVAARAVGEIGFATHGWKLAKTDEARYSRAVA